MYIDATILAGLVIIVLTTVFLVWGIVFAYKHIASDSLKNETTENLKFKH